MPKNYDDTLKEKREAEIIKIQAEADVYRSQADLNRALAAEADARRQFTEMQIEELKENSNDR